MEKVYIPGGEGTGVYLRGWLPQQAVNLCVLLSDYLQKHTFTFTDTQIDNSVSTWEESPLTCFTVSLPLPTSLPSPHPSSVPAPLPFPVRSLLTLLSSLLHDHCMVSSFGIKNLSSFLLALFVFPCVSGLPFDQLFSWSQSNLIPHRGSGEAKSQRIYPVITKFMCLCSVKHMIIKCCHMSRYQDLVLHRSKVPFEAQVFFIRE